MPLTDTTTDDVPTIMDRRVIRLARDYGMPVSVVMDMPMQTINQLEQHIVIKRKEAKPTTLRDDLRNVWQYILLAALTFLTFVPVFISVYVLSWAGLPSSGWSFVLGLAVLPWMNYCSTLIKRYAFRKRHD